MKLKNEKEFYDWFATQKNDGSGIGYGEIIFHYAWRWALLMEYLMDEGYTFDEMARDASHIADVEGVSGFMYGCAAAVISQCWIYGEEFRRWYNLDNQLVDEGEQANENGGVLNPALLRIG